MEDARIYIDENMRAQIEARKLGDERLTQTARRILRAGLKIVKKVEEDRQG